MIIEESEFRLTQYNNSSDCWDVEVMTKVQPKGEKARMEYKTIAYGCSLITALKKIIKYKIEKKHSDNKINAIKTQLKKVKMTLQQINDIYLIAFNNL